MSRLSSPVRCLILQNSNSTKFASTSARETTGIVAPITLRTCVGIYDRLRQTWPHLYSNAPSQGLDLTVLYADTHLGKRPEEYDRLIVAVHGNYGSYEHYDKLLAHYRGTRTRVVVPNLPDFTHTRSTGVFWHSTVEKAAFVTDFLRQLGITKVDCFVSHSFGFQTAAAIWGEPERGFDIRSVALFAPQSFWIAYTPIFNKMKYVFILRNEPWYKFLDAIGIHRNFRWPMRYTNLNDFLMNCTLTIDHQSPRDLHRRLEHLRAQSSVPVSIMCGARDKLIYPESVQAIHQKIGFAEEDVIEVHPDKDQPEVVLASSSESPRRIRSYRMLNSGHMLHANHPQFAHEMIENLLKRVK